MQHIFTTTALGFALLLTDMVRAGEMNAPAQPLQVSIIQEAAEFAEPFYSAYVTAGENKFTFVIPQGFRSKEDTASGKLVLGNQDGDCYLSFTILGSAPTDASEVNAEACRAYLHRLHPEGKILTEFSASAVGKNGQGIDIQWKATENLYECGRFVFIPTEFGTFVFTATSGRKNFAQCQSNLGLVTGTFRASTDGKFHPIHIAATN